MRMSPFTPYSQNIIGEGSGTGEALAKVIIDDQGGRATKLPLLYLTGDKNKDTLPTLAQAAGLDLEPLQVYGTRGSPKFSAGVGELFRRHLPLGECGFRPSPMEMALTVIDHCRSYAVVGRVLCSVVCRVRSPHSARTPRLLSGRRGRPSRLLQGRSHRAYDGDAYQREVRGKGSCGRSATHPGGSWRSVAPVCIDI